MALLTTSDATTPPREIGRRTGLLCGVLFLVTLVVYGRMLGHDFIHNWDDNVYVVENAAIQGFSWEHLRTIFSRYYLGNYAPVQLLSYQIDHAIWGLRPGGFLLTNLLLHALNGCLLHGLFTRLYSDRSLALVATLLFLLHPVQVETVAWISQRKTLLAMTFFLLAWHRYQTYLEEPPGAGHRAYVTALCAFGLGLLAKSIVVILPVLLLVQQFCFPGEKSGFRWRGLLPFFLLALVLGGVAVHSQTTDVTVKAHQDYFSGSVAATFFTMLPVLWSYLKLLLWPAGLSAAYILPIRTSFDLAVLASLLLLAGLGYLGFRLYRSDRRLLFWLVLVLVALVPVSQIVPLPTLMNDRYLYFPLIGVAALAGSGALALYRLAGSQHAAKLRLVLVLVLAVLALVSFQRTAVWRNSLTLWSDAVSKSPGSPMAWECLGEAQQHVGNDPAAIAAFERALTLNPELPLALNNLGGMYIEAGELERGYAAIQKLLVIDPRFALGWANLGHYFHVQHRYGEAESALQHALELDPGSLQVLYELGVIAQEQQHFDQSVALLLAADSRASADPVIAYKLATSHGLAGHLDEALHWLELALQRGHDDVKVLLADPALSGVRHQRTRQFNGLLERYFPLPTAAAPAPTGQGR
jgi:tetratricopeptide (TPR) repeat protein